MQSNQYFTPTGTYLLYQGVSETPDGKTGWSVKLQHLLELELEYAKGREQFLAAIRGMESPLFVKRYWYTPMSPIAKNKVFGNISSSIVN